MPRLASFTRPGSHACSVGAWAPAGGQETRAGASNRAACA
jgi:hypothetical protein